MSKHYCLVAGLPGITLEDSKLAFSLTDFREEINKELSASEKRIIDLYFLKFDNMNVAQYLTNPDAEFNKKGNISKDEIEDLINALKNEENHNLHEILPSYLLDFLKDFFSNNDKQGTQNSFWKEKLAGLYLEYAAKSKNRFARSWFELNQNINNILTAITCKKYEIDKENYIVGNSEVANAIRNSNAKDFGLGNSIDYLPALLRIAEEPDLLMREKKIDLLKWQWLEENTFFQTFDIEKVFAYLLQLEMIERWVELDKAKGEQTFRTLVRTMKRGSVDTLTEFKKNTNK